MKNKLKLWSLSITLLLLAMNSYATPFGSDSIRIEHLNERIEINDKRIDTAIEREERFLRIFEISIYFIGLVITILGAFGIKSISEVKKEYETKVKEAKEDLEKKLIEETNSLKNESIKHLNALVTEESLTRILKNKSNIIVINPEPSGDDKNLERILGEFNNTVVRSCKFSDTTKLVEIINTKFKANQFNIVLLEDSDGRWDIGNKENPKSIIDAVNLVKSASKDVFFLYFGPGFFPDKANQYNLNSEEFRSIIARIAYTNSPSKLYINILDTLRFMNLISNP